MSSFYWHDYETWGSSPARDRPSQFAGVRTDAELNEIGEPLVLYCQPPADDLPHPEACLITGITPQKAAAEGVCEADFVAAIHRELAQPGTCGVGYNSIRFDDEVTRYSLYRNFYDPYAREWQNGNSRWDLIDVVRACWALRPEGVEWPLREDGYPSFKLEALSAANGLEHAQAHDALSDVRATIGLARLIRTRQPRLFDYLLGLRDKRQVAQLLDVARRKPVLHVSGMFGAQRGCTALVVPLAYHPRNRNGVICMDLGVDPRPLLELGVDQIRERVFTAQAELPEGLERIPLKVIHLNRCPVVATPKLLDDKIARRINLDTHVCEKHYQQLLKSADIAEKVVAVFNQPLQDAPQETDVDAALYQGFLPDADRKLMAAVHEAPPAAIDPAQFPFRDPRLTELLFRYRARNAPDSLDADERLRWRQHCCQSIEQRWGESAAGFLQRLDELAREQPQSPILEALREYSKTMLSRSG